MRDGESGRRGGQVKRKRTASWDAYSDPAEEDQGRRRVVGHLDWLGCFSCLWCRGSVRGDGDRPWKVSDTTAQVAA
jgi:hypothetical protein